MKPICKQRVVQTIDLGYEQMHLIGESDEEIRVLFRGFWLREDPAEGRQEGTPRRTGSS